jgi:hypothetical protein
MQNATPATRAATLRIWKNPLKRGQHREAAWIPAFAGMTDEDAFARTTEFHDMQSSRGLAAALLSGTVPTSFYFIGEAL